jgi:hypothetical protein
MKKCWLLFPLVLASCIAKPIISETACNDPVYLSLKAKSIDSMTDREFAYFQMKDRECEHARSSANAVEQLQSSGVDKQIISETACNDSLYLKLKEKPAASMTAREYSYFEMKDRECEEARASANSVKQLKTGSQETGILLLAIDVVLLAALLILVH